MRAVAVYVRLTRKKRYATREAGIAFLHSAKGPSDPRSRVLAACEVTTHQVRGRDVHVVRRRGATASDSGVVVYLHGGAYTNEIVDQQWAFVAALAQRAGVEVHVPIYGLAPHHTASEAVAFVGEVVDSVVSQGRRCVLVGDSAGGGLALVAAQQARPQVREGVPGLLLVAPWIDLTMTNPEVDAVERSDPWLTGAGLHPIAQSWAGDLALDDPQVSPLFGDAGCWPARPLRCTSRTAPSTTTPCCRPPRAGPPAARSPTGSWRCSAARALLAEVAHDHRRGVPGTQTTPRSTMASATRV